MGGARRIMSGSGRRYAAIAAVALGLLAAACGDDTTTSSPSSDSRTVSVKAVDYGFEGLPSSVKAGTALRLTNESKLEAHELVAVKLPDNERRPVADLLKLPEAQLMGMFTGPPALVLLAPPAVATRSWPRVTARSRNPAATWSSATFRPAPTPAPF